ARPLAPLAGSLARDLARVLAARPEPDPRKARLSRVGGRCPDDGTLLAFDPFAPTEHRCPRCGATLRGDAHDRWWVMWHHLWLAERAVHAAVLHLLVGAPPLAAFAAETLAAWADRYLDYPNRDNVLGPSRPFFSTYLESIWLLQLCVALDALEAAEGPRVASLGARLRERVVEPSRRLIAGFPEGGSNRQVWNAAALLASSRVLGDARGAARAFDGAGGVVERLGDGLLADGTWYEGENYHQFAHRGLWYGAALAEAAGMTVPDALRRRFDDGFAAPYLVALPDLTLPARRDSQYAISLRQWRYAESFELGFARTGDVRLAAALTRLYDGAVARGDTGRCRSAAESERNEPPSALDRADLGWRALLYASAEPPPSADWAPGAVHLEAQGLAVFRRDAGRLWVAVDYGHSGGGHGHPDRLQLLVSDGATRRLDDMGTGSYVERALHWYRSTLAHNAPLVDGASQARGDGRLIALAEDGDASGIAAECWPADGVHVARAVALHGEVVVDRLHWRADRAVVLDLPYHVEGDAALAWEPASRTGAGGLEDGFDFLADVERASLPDAGAVRLALRDGGALWLLAGAELWRATAPGAPGRGPRRFHVVHAAGEAAALLAVLDPRGRVAGVAQEGGEVTIALVDGGSTTHRLPEVGDPRGAWAITHRAADGGERSLRLGLPLVPGARPAPAARARASSEDGTRLPLPCTVELEEPHYRPSEESWEEAGRPTAAVTLSADPGRFRIALDVRLDRPTTFVPAGADNPLDNERPAVNGDGVELFVRARGDALAGWLVVPEGEGDPPRVVPTTPDAAALSLEAAWRRTGRGYAMELAIDRGALAAVTGDARTVRLDVLVNEMPPGRERRRGQLVLSGAEGRFVYLQGDRHDPARCVAVQLPPPAAP
ncbi:heparinase II/III family protein, partial [Roseisolibacter sp. H3M3-2]|uniref:heparinase II/III domain-containing protein n=1 Tax=Roseisolibacter sp. H3M3-2 TaxID=3031323 RepID=UPI0023DC030F